MNPGATEEPIKSRDVVLWTVLGGAVQRNNTKFRGWYRKQMVQGCSEDGMKCGRSARWETETLTQKKPAGGHNCRVKSTMNRVALNFKTGKPISLLLEKERQMGEGGLRGGS